MPQVSFVLIKVHTEDDLNYRHLMDLVHKIKQLQLLLLTVVPIMVPDGHHLLSHMGFVGGGGTLSNKIRDLGDLLIGMS